MDHLATLTQVRTRTVSRHPKNGGQECPTDLSESRSCSCPGAGAEEIQAETISASNSYECGYKGPRSRSGTG